MKAVLECECCAARLEVAEGKEAEENFHEPELEIRTGNFRAAAAKHGWSFHPTFCIECREKPDAVTVIEKNRRRREEYRKLYGAFKADEA